MPEYEVTVDIALIGTDRNMTKNIVRTITAPTLPDAVVEAQRTTVAVIAVAARLKPTDPPQLQRELADTPDPSPSDFHG